MLNKSIMTMGALAVSAIMAFPMAASAVTITTQGGAVENAAVGMSIGDVFAIEIGGNAIDGGGTASFGFTATEILGTVETNSLNPHNGEGFTFASVEWNSEADGSGISFGSVTGEELKTGEFKMEFALGETKWLIASWEDVTQDLSNFDLRLVATPVPLPAGVLLMGTALAGFGVMSRRRRKS